MGQIKNAITSLSLVQKITAYCSAILAIITVITVFETIALKFVIIPAVTDIELLKKYVIGGDVFYHDNRI